MNSCPGHNFFVLWSRHTIFGIWVYHYETMCHVYSWPLYDLDLWPQDKKYQFFNMNSCLGHNFFVLCHRHPVFGRWMHHHAMMCHVLCLSVCPSACFNSCLGHNFFVLWSMHTISSIFVYQYERMYCIHSWPIYDLWPYDLEFDLNVKGISSLTWIIFGMWVYHHEKMCHLHSWSQYNLDLNVKVKLEGFLTCICVRAISSLIKLQCLKWA